MLLKARINNLRQYRVHNEKKANRSLQTASKINSTRERVIDKQKFQALIADKRENESEILKTRTNKFRIDIKKELEKSKSKVA